MVRSTAVIAVLLLLASSGLCLAQTSTPPGIDVELYSPVDGTNRVCIASAGSAWAYLFVRPGADSFTCSPSCAPPDAAGGSANLAAAVLDIAFDPTRLTYLAAENNPSSAAVDGLLQLQNLAAGRVGWTLAGDWTPDADPTSTLASPCAMHKLDTPGWVVRLQLRGDTPGMTALRLRRAGDPQPFPLSFADICGSPAFTEASGAVDEVGDLVVLVAATCDDVLFFDSFERRDASAWSASAP